MSAHPTFKVRLFGGSAPLKEVDSSIRLPERATILVALLILRFQGQARRSILRHLLWEDAPAEKASANLRWLISAIRKTEKQHGFRLIRATTSTIEGDEDLRSDVQELLSIQAVQSSSEVDHVLNLYAGPLLSELTAQRGGDLERLIEHYRTICRRKLLSLMPSVEALGHDQGKRLWDRLCQAHPFDEDVFQGYLRFLTRNSCGQEYAEALQHSSLRLPLPQKRRGAIGISGPAQDLTRFSSEGFLPAGLFHPNSARAPAIPVGQPSIPRLVILPPSCPFKIPLRTRQIADALIENVTIFLCRMRSFAMLAPYTARQVFEGITPASQTAADYMAYTSLVPNCSSSHRLTLALVRSATGEILVGDEVEVNESSLPEKFADIAELVAVHISGLVEKSEIASFRSTGAASAYVHFLLGSRWIRKGELSSLRKARKHFARSISMAPNYVPALAGLARCFTLEWLALRRSDDELLRIALQHSKKAVEIDPLHPDGWRELAHVNLYLKELDQSLESLQVARSRARHHADILADEADVLVHMSRMVEAKARIEEAINLNPAVPDDYHWVLGSAEFFLGHYQAALDTLLMMRRQDEVSRLIAAAAAMAGDASTASMYRQKWLEIYPDSTLDGFASFIPHRNQHDVEHYLHALRQAGFP